VKSKKKKNLSSREKIIVLRNFHYLLFRHLLFYIIAIVLISVANCKQIVGKGNKEQKPKTQNFTFEMIYTKGITEINCFSVQLLEIQREEIIPFLSGFVVVDFTKESKARASKVEFREIGREWQGGGTEPIKGEEIKIDLFQDKLSVSIISPVFPKNRIYLEMRGFTLLDPTESCEAIYSNFRDYGISSQNIAIRNVAIGRSRVIDPQKENQAKGIFARITPQNRFSTEPENIIIQGDELPETFDFKIAYPIFVELEENTETKMRKFMLCGGINLETESVLRTCKIFDEEKLSFEEEEIPMNYPRVFGSATKLPDGKIVVSGGLSYDLKPIGTFEIFFPELGLFLKTTKIIPRFLHYTFSTEKNIGIVGGVGDDGLWEKDLEVFPLSQTTESERFIKGLHVLDYAGKFGSCFAENKNYVYIIGGVNSRKVAQIKKERIDLGTIEAQDFEITKLGDNEIKSLGSCQAVAFEQRVVGVSSLGYIFSFTVDQGELKFQGQKLPDPEQELIRTKKAFSFQKVSDLQAVLFGGIDYIQQKDNPSYLKQVSSSYELFVISSKGDILGKYKYRTKYPRIGGVAILTQGEYLIIFGGTKEGKSEVVFIGDINLPQMGGIL
jgi:hypothetical protein